MNKHKPQKNEGEGSRSADRNYRAGLQKHLEKKNVDEEARKAKEAIEGKEGEELKKAEEAAKRGKTLKH
jgi:hypothetical protein